MLTLQELLTKPESHQITNQEIYNPLRLPIGSSILINIEPYQMHISSILNAYEITEIREFNHFASIATRKMVEYICVSKQPSRHPGAPPVAILKLVPHLSTYRILLLTVFLELTDPADIRKVMMDVDGTDTYTVGSDEVYFRYNAAKLPCLTEVKSLGKDSLSIERVEYWDYGRDHDNSFQFMYIEKNSTTMQFKRGIEIQPDSVICLDYQK